MADLILYTLAGCPTCDRARRDLSAEGIDFEERRVDDNAQWFEEATKLSLTVPVIVRGDRIEVGWKGESG